MARTPTAVRPTVTEQTASFPVSLTILALRDAVLDVFLHYMTTICRMTDEATAWRIVGLPVTEGPSLFDYDRSADEFGLTYVHIRQTKFARVMEHLYWFAFFGRFDDESAESMFEESVYTWVSAIVCDAAYGYLANEYDSYGGTICDNAQKCVLVAELANARHMLEGGESFYNGFRGRGNKDNALSEGSLNVHQMALLSGMEEMSIRAAANPKRATPLQTHVEDGGTRIALDVAKAWLQSKGRYIPITWSADEIDLAKSGFANPSALIEALEARRAVIAARGSAQELNDRLAELGVIVEKQLDGHQWGINLSDENLMRTLATVLELPVDLLVLRTKEMLANEQLSQIQRQLREITIATTKINN